MLRRRKARKSASAAAGLKFAKGATRRVEKARRRASESKVIVDTRLKVFARDKVCRCCGGARKQYHWGFSQDEMHEIVPRSKTRGMAPEKRFSTKNCVRLCHWCHQDVTEKRLTVLTTAAGADGNIAFVGGGVK